MKELSDRLGLDKTDTYPNELAKHALHYVSSSTRAQDVGARGSPRRKRRLHSLPVSSSTPSSSSNGGSPRRGKRKRVEDEGKSQNGKRTKRDRKASYDFQRLEQQEANELASRKVSRSASASSMNGALGVEEEDEEDEDYNDYKANYEDEDADV